MAVAFRQCFGGSFPVPDVPRHSYLTIAGLPWTAHLPEYSLRAFTLNIAPVSGERKAMREDLIGFGDGCVDPIPRFSTPLRRKPMPLKYLSKKFFPREDQWQRRRQFRSLVMAIGVAIGFGGVIGGIILFFAKR